MGYNYVQIKVCNKSADVRSHCYYIISVDDVVVLS